jgi:hypothetical protein
MARTKQASKRNRPKIALPVWGAAGMSLAMAGGASANVVTADTGAKRAVLPSAVTLGEEELSDVSLSTFFVFDREASNSARLGEKVAQRCGRGCGGCRGCAVRRCGGGCGGCRGCAVVRRCGGCGVGIACARCSCSCCLSWGSCQIC